MKPKVRNILIGIIVAIAVCAIAITVAATTFLNSSGHIALISGSSLDRIAIIDEDGKTVWQIAQSELSWIEVNDADLLPNGDVVFAARKDSGSTVYMVRPDYPNSTGYEILWTYDVPTGAENHTSQALSDGGVLIGEAYNTYIRIVELDADGKVRKTLGGTESPLPDWPTITRAHDQIRQIHKTAEGTYLVAAMGAEKTIEYSAMGEKLAEYPAGGFTAIKDAEGNVIISGGNSRRITCYEKNSTKIRWVVDSYSFSNLEIGFAASVQVLENGNIVFANWGGHGGAAGKAVTEFTVPVSGDDPEIVWTLNSGSNTSNVQIADWIDESIFEGAAFGSSNNYRSPIDVVGSEQSGTVYVADETNNTIEILSALTGKHVGQISVTQKPNTLLLSADGKYLYVATGAANGRVEVFNTVTNLPEGSVNVGHTPSALALSEDGNTLYVANRFGGTLQTIALTNGAIAPDTAPSAAQYVTREPMSMAVKGSKLYVGGHLPTGDMTDGTVSSEVVVVNTANMDVAKTITMVSGSTNLKDIALSPDGEYLYVSHALGRWNVATTHVDRGWIYTNAITEIRTSDDTVRATMMVDDLDHGAANPWGIDVSEDKIVLSIAGTREMMILDRTGLREKIEKVYAGTIGGNGYLETPEDIPQDLTFTGAFKKRVDLEQDGPRGIELLGDKVYTANYFGGSVSIYDVNTKRVSTVKLATTKAEDAVRGGERLWNDATICVGEWQSCSSCHPDARTDGLNWDNMNDGIGTPKQARSMVGAWERGRVMASGIRANAQVANRAGVKYICFNAGLPESEIEKIDAFVQSLMPEESPYLENGKLSESASRGKTLFEGKANCASCHAGKLYSADMLIYENYTQSDTETRGLLVPPLSEAWRSGPYLHDGSAATIMDVLTTRNVTGTHGTVSDLSEAELTDLCNYVLSLGFGEGEAYRPGGNGDFIPETPNDPTDPSVDGTTGVVGGAEQPNNNWIAWTASIAGVAVIAAGAVVGIFLTKRHRKRKNNVS